MNEFVDDGSFSILCNCDFAVLKDVTEFLHQLLVCHYQTCIYFILYIYNNLSDLNMTHVVCLIAQAQYVFVDGMVRIGMYWNGKLWKKTFGTQLAASVILFCFGLSFSLDKMIKLILVNVVTRNVPNSVYLYTFI